MYGFDPSVPPPPYTEHMKLFTPKSWDILSKSLAKTSETGIPYELELETVRPGKSSGWMWVRGEAVFDYNKKIIGLWGAAQDISERKKLELDLVLAKEKIEESEKQLKHSQQVAKIGYYIFDIVKGLWTSSEMLDEMFGIDKKYLRDVEGWIECIYHEDR